MQEEVLEGGHEKAPHVVSRDSGGSRADILRRLDAPTLVRAGGAGGRGQGPGVGGLRGPSLPIGGKVAAAQQALPRVAELAQVRPLPTAPPRTTSFTSAGGNVPTERVRAEGGARLSAWLCHLVSAPARSAADGVAPRWCLQARRLHRRLGLPRRGGTGAGGAGGPCGAPAAPQSGQLRASAARTILARCALGPAISQRPQRLPGTRSNART